MQLDKFSLPKRCARITFTNPGLARRNRQLAKEGKAESVPDDINPVKGLAFIMFAASSPAFPSS